MKLYYFSTKLLNLNLLGIFIGVISGLIVNLITSEYAGLYFYPTLLLTFLILIFIYLVFLHESYLKLFRIKKEDNLKLYYESKVVNQKSNSIERLSDEDLWEQAINHKPSSKVAYFLSLFLVLFFLLSAVYGIKSANEKIVEKRNINEMSLSNQFKSIKDSIDKLELKIYDLSNENTRLNDSIIGLLKIKVIQSKQGKKGKSHN